MIYFRPDNAALAGKNSARLLPTGRTELEGRIILLSIFALGAVCAPSDVDTERREQERSAIVHHASLNEIRKYIPNGAPAQV